MELKSFLLVGAGGAIGSMLRYFISLMPIKSDFPYATITANLLGALLIGFICGLVSQKNISNNLVLMMKTGVCGGFTTFSTFSLESFKLFESGKTATGVIYVLLSLAGCILGVWAGIVIGTYTAKN